MDQHRVLIVSPVRNESAHVERVARAMAAQTHRPASWLVVDDGSDDGTVAILRRLEAEIPFMRVLERPPSPDSADRLAEAAEVRAFNWALEQAGELDGVTHVGKLDGDIELAPDHFERLLARFDANQALGLAGCVLVERHGETWRQIRIPPSHIHGAVKLYSRGCFDAIGGLEPRLGWDTIDQTYARMHGFETRTFDDLRAIHHRHFGSAQGVLRGRARHGECAWVAHQGLGWVTLRALKVARLRPVGLSGAAFMYGYLRAAARRSPRVDDAEFRRFVRRELRGRVRAGLRPGHAS